MKTHVGPVSDPLWSSIKDILSSTDMARRSHDERH